MRPAARAAACAAAIGLALACAASLRAQPLADAAERREEAELRHAVRRSAEARDPLTEALSQRLLAQFLRSRGRGEEASAREERALALHRSVGDYASVLAQAGALPPARREAELVWVVRAAASARDRWREATAHHLLAEALGARGDAGAALEHIRRAMALFRATGDRRGVANTQGFLGYQHMNAGRYAEALPPLEEALALFRALSPHGVRDRNQLNMLQALARCRRALGQAERADSADREAALALAQVETGAGAGRGGPEPDPADPRVPDEVREWFERARQVDGDRPAMLRAYEGALQCARRLGSLDGQADALWRMGNALLLTGDCDAAAECSGRAADLYERAGRTDRQADATYRAGDAHQRADRFSQALVCFQRSLDLGSGSIEYLASQGAFRSCTRMRRWDLALTYARRWALTAHAEIYEGSDDGRTALVAAYAATGEWAQSEAEWARIADLCRDGETPRDAAVFERNGANAVAWCLMDGGQAWSAIEFLRRRIAGCAAAGETHLEALLWRALADVYFQLGVPARAADCAERAARVPASEVDSYELGRLSSFHLVAGRAETAVGYARRCVAAARVEGDPWRKGEAACLLARALYHAGRLPEALTWCRVVLRDTALPPVLRALALGVIGGCHLAMGRPRDALGPCTQAVEVAAGAYSPDRVEALCNLAAALDAVGRRTEAAARLREATDLAEGLRATLGDQPEAASQALSTSLQAYHQAIALYLKAGQPERAFSTAQRAKAAVLSDTLMRAGVRSAGLSSADRRRIAALRARVDAANRSLLASAGSSTGAARRSAERGEARLNALEGELQACIDEARARAAGVRPPIDPAASLVGLAKALPPDTALLEYVVLRAGHGRPWLDRTVVFVVTARAGRLRVTAHAARIRQAQMAGLVGAMRESCALRQGSWDGPARKLYAHLVAPVAARIAGYRRLVVCPDERLWDVPFAALASGGAPRPTFLIERFEVTYAYSAACLATVLTRRARPRSPSGSVLVVANPSFGGGTQPGPARVRGSVEEAAVEDLYGTRSGTLRPLPGSEWEARAIAKLYPGAVVRTGAAAQEQAVKRLAGSQRMLHFATHGFVSAAAPMLSCLALARPPAGGTEDGYLTAREVLDLNVAADLVTLSACNTARGEVRRGEGVVGLLWAFAAAGARAQMSAQWAVQDASACDLMRGFYAHLRAGQGKGAALRAACLGLLRQRKTSHPHHWAPFVLVGDWR